MPEVTQIVYTHEDLAKALIRDRGLDSGHWAVLIRFRFEGGNLQTVPDVMTPAAITFIESIGLQRFDEPNPLTVDASTLSESRPRRKARPVAQSA